jgi:hypothetical protein
MPYTLLLLPYEYNMCCALLIALLHSTTLDSNVSVIVLLLVDCTATKRYHGAVFQTVNDVPVMMVLSLNCCYSSEAIADTDLSANCFCM